MAPTKRKKNPVKKNMDRFHKPKTHRDKTKYNRKDKSKKVYSIFYVKSFKNSWASNNYKRSHYSLNKWIH